MHILKIVAATLASGLVAAPAFAAGPAGNWACTMAGAPAGSLTVEASTYSFAPAGGAKGGSGDYSFDLNVLQIASGPLKDLGVAIGYYNGGATPPGLVFNLGPGKGLKCSPA